MPLVPAGRRRAGKPTEAPPRRSEGSLGRQPLSEMPPTASAGARLFGLVGGTHRVWVVARCAVDVGAGLRGRTWDSPNAGSAWRPRGDTY